MQKDNLIFIPTYNERQNVHLMAEQLLDLPIEADILFLDDNSPDGTGEVLDQLSAQNNRIQVLHRPAKKGIGSAHKDGIRYAYNNGYSVLITMDCDFAHSPDRIPVFIEAFTGCDVIVGSRFLSSQSLAGWNPYRKLLTRLGHLLTLHLLKLRYDATGAFRLYRLSAMPQELFARIKSNGYSFFFESLFALHHAGMNIKELPIDLPPRVYGQSKMTNREIIHSINMLIRLGTQFPFRRKQTPASPFPYRLRR